MGSIADLILAFVALAGAGVALKQYAEQGRRDRARWLAELHDKFYESDNFRRVYLALDGCDPQQLARLEAALAGGSDPEVEWELTRYLNFFLFVESGAPAMDGYLRENGYERLAEMTSRRHLQRAR